MYESGEAAHDERATPVQTVIYLQMFEGASQYTGGRSIISVEVELFACCMLGTSFFLRYNHVFELCCTLVWNRPY